MLQPFLFIEQTTRTGRGVFTKKEIPAGSILEISPVLVFTATERALLDRTLLHDYIFEWGIQKNLCCVGLGYLSVYNHSYRANCEYEMDFERKEMKIVTVRKIEAGEELFINYNGDWNNPNPVWFDSI
jgi:uncharacterized protein